MQTLLDAGISSRRGIMCSHREPAYSGAVIKHSLAQSERAQDRCILLPLFHDLGDAALSAIATKLADVAGQTATPSTEASVRA
jgi:dTDP-4-amino-4,6-dideoxygalactose transaminase